MPKWSLGKISKFPSPVLRMLKSSSTHEKRLVMFFSSALGVQY